jgi:CRP/FNR family transcriptional regulator, cyclic AMP receptor protein
LDCETSHRRLFDSVRLHKDAKLELLKGVPLFAHCSRKELEEIGRIADELDFREGKELTREGSRGREFFVLLEGTVEVVRDGKRVATLGKGDFFGELALISNIPRTATVTATSPIRTLVVFGRDFRRLLQEDPGIATKVLGVMAERMPPADTH